MIYDLDHRAPLGKSGHAVLSFSLNRYMERQTSNCAKRHYDKGDYTGLRNDLLLDLETILRPFKDPDTQFNYLNDKIQTEIESIYHNFRVNLKQTKRAPIDSDLRKLVKRKKRLWTRVLDTRNNNKYEEYSKIRS